jgi:hypothetical protein|tara:strand:+ start:505 stop:1404 length:900 start_codon:yes stop_codon:yes gene_type:complete
MKEVKLYKGGNAVPDLEVVDFWKESLKDLTDVILTDQYSFPNTGEIFVDKFDKYIKASKLNNLKGLNSYKHRSYVHGTSQTFDSFWLRNHDKRFRCFKGEFFYHKASWKKFHTWCYLEDDHIQTNDAVVISLPFSDYGKEHPRMREILDECERWEVPVLIDCAYYVIGEGINFDFTEYDCIEDITFSLSKGFHLSNRIRAGIRYTKEYYDDNIHMYNEWRQYSHLSAHLGTKLLSHFPPDYPVNKWRDKQLKFCKKHNFKPSDCVIFAFGGDEYKELNRGTEVNRLCISYLIGDKIDEL